MVARRGGGGGSEREDAAEDGRGEDAGEVRRGRGRREHMVRRAAGAVAHSRVAREQRGLGGRGDDAERAEEGDEPRREHVRQVRVLPQRGDERLDRSRVGVEASRVAHEVARLGRDDAQQDAQAPDARVDAQEPRALEHDEHRRGVLEPLDEARRRGRGDSLWGPRGIGRRRRRTPTPTPRNTRLWQTRTTKRRRPPARREEGVPELARVGDGRLPREAEPQPREHVHLGQHGVGAARRGLVAEPREVRVQVRVDRGEARVLDARAHGDHERRRRGISVAGLRRLGFGCCCCRRCVMIPRGGRPR
mmetsp:Transcript_14692/g.58742  ORF Transcript_14692/g.58742 Transcript_14692/m.58742 type:complete len:305 (-) Transcript_14692:339-1253(-)